MPAAQSVDLSFKKRASFVLSRLFIQVFCYSFIIKGPFLPQVPGGSFLHCIGGETEAADNHRVVFPHRSRENSFAAAAGVSFDGFFLGAGEMDVWHCWAMASMWPDSGLCQAAMQRDRQLGCFCTAPNQEPAGSEPVMDMAVGTGHPWPTSGLIP